MSRERAGHAADWVSSSDLAPAAVVNPGPATKVAATLHSRPLDKVVFASAGRRDQVRPLTPAEASAFEAYAATNAGTLKQPIPAGRNDRRCRGAALPALPRRAQV